MTSFDRVAHLYDATRALPPEVERQVGDAVARCFREVAPAPQVLEIGVGTGRIAVPLARRGVRVTGIDMARDMLAVLRGKRAPVRAVRALADALPFPDRVFDGALFVHILHLVPDAGGVVRAACRTLRPGGVVVSGGDEAPSGLMAEMLEALRAASRTVGIDLVLWDRHRLGLEGGRRALEALGAVCRSERIAAWTSPASARDLLDRLRHRVNSVTWPLSDEALEALVAAATPELERVCGGLDRVHDAQRGFRVLVARLPEA